MQIQKFGHSCVQLTESGQKLLFDPGVFVFIEGKLTPEDIGPVDVVVITHTHPDHYFPEALQKLYALKPFQLLVSEATQKTMEADGVQIPTRVIAAGERIEVGSFSVQTYDCPHEQIPIPCPHNMAYKINDAVYHPGDSYMVPEGLGEVAVLLVPTGGPWATTKQSVAFVEQVHPQRAIPIHDAMHKEFWLERLNGGMLGWLKERGVEYKVLAPGETVEL